MKPMRRRGRQVFPARQPTKENHRLQLNQHLCVLNWNSRQMTYHTSLCWFLLIIWGSSESWYYCSLNISCAPCIYFWGSMLYIRTSKIIGQRVSFSLQQSRNSYFNTRIVHLCKICWLPSPFRRLGLSRYLPVGAHKDSLAFQYHAICEVFFLTLSTERFWHSTLYASSE